MEIEVYGNRDAGIKNMFFNKNLIILYISYNFFFFYLTIRQGQQPIQYSYMGLSYLNSWINISLYGCIP